MIAAPPWLDSHPVFTPQPPNPLPNAQAMDSAALRGKLRRPGAPGAGAAVGAEDILFLVRKVGWHAEGSCAPMGMPAVMAQGSGQLSHPGFEGGCAAT